MAAPPACHPYAYLVHRLLEGAKIVAIAEDVIIIARDRQRRQSVRSRSVGQPLSILRQELCGDETLFAVTARRVKHLGRIA